MNRRRVRGWWGLRCAESVIRTACRALPAAERDDREQEWSAEAEAVACDPDIPWPALRTLKTLLFAASLLLHARATRSTPAAAVRLAGRPRQRAAIADRVLSVLGGGVCAGLVFVGGGIYFGGVVVGVGLGGVARDRRRGRGEGA